MMNVYRYPFRGSVIVNGVQMLAELLFEQRGYQMYAVLYIAGKELYVNPLPINGQLARGELADMFHTLCRCAEIKLSA